MAVAFPLASMVITSGFVLDQDVTPMPEGGTPSPNSTLIENDTISPTRMLFIDGESCTDSTGANGDW
jgi:hypothetical protein